MDDLLTTRQLQDLLKVDRITIYRMLEDGRLRGFKVGGQWRFRRREIERWLEGRRGDKQLSEPVPAAERTAKTPIPLSCAQAIQGILADACEVAALILTAEAEPFTTISRPCAFCNLVLGTVEGRARCVRSWQVILQGFQVAPRVYRCHAGLEYIAVGVEVEGDPAAAVVAGQFITVPRSAGAWEPALTNLAAACGVDRSLLLKSALQVPVCGSREVERITRLVRRTGETLAEMGRERVQLLGRLQQIAEMAAVD